MENRSGNIEPKITRRINRGNITCYRTINVFNRCPELIGCFSSAVSSVTLVMEVMCLADGGKSLLVVKVKFETNAIQSKENIKNIQYQDMLEQQC